MIKKILRQTFTIIFLLFFVSCASTSSRVPHPPTYEDFVKLQTPNDEELNADFFLRRIELLNCISSCDNPEGKETRPAEQIMKECVKNKEDEKLIEEIIQNLQFQEAMQFTEEEITRIRRANNSWAIIGAAIQTEPDNPLGTELLESAAASERPSALALVSLIDRYFVLESTESADSSLAGKIQASIAKLLQAAPDNALSYYLNGYSLHLSKKDDEALLQVREGNAKKEITNYARERFYAVVQAAEALGYSQFTARQHAMNYSIPSELYSSLAALCKELLTTERKKNARIECLGMGELIESSGHFTYEKIQGLIIQSLAYRESTAPKDVERMNKIIEKERAILANSRKLLKIPFSEIPEDVWLKYFEMYFSADEIAAGAFIEDYYKRNAKNYKE